MSYTKHTTKGPKANEADIILMFLNIHALTQWANLLNVFIVGEKYIHTFLFKDLS
jgi:hypothetical protein